MLAPTPAAPAPHMYHVQLPPETTVWNWRVVKVLLFHLPPDSPLKESNTVFDAAIAGVKTRVGTGDIQGIEEVAGGWVEELLDLTSADGASNMKCKGYVLASAWQDMHQLKESEASFTDVVFGLTKGHYSRYEDEIIDFTNGREPAGEDEETI